MRQSQEGRPLRQFTLSTGKSAGRNSSGLIMVFHRGGGSKRLQRRIDLKRSTSSMGIVERIEYDPNRSSRIAPVLWISRMLWDWGMTWPFFVFFVDGIDWILSSMDGLPLSVGGGGSDAGPSSTGHPELDLNQSPAPEPGLDLNSPSPAKPEPAPPAEPAPAPPAEPAPAPPAEPAPEPRPFSSLSKEEELKKTLNAFAIIKGCSIIGKGKWITVFRKTWRGVKRGGAEGRALSGLKKSIYTVDPARPTSDYAPGRMPFNLVIQSGRIG
ncbi:hypothetical protein CsSME_00047135 [Camellia sinensis var. sinensis]